MSESFHVVVVVFRHYSFLTHYKKLQSHFGALRVKRSSIYNFGGSLTWCANINTLFTGEDHLLFNISVKQKENRSCSDQL